MKKTKGQGVQGRGKTDRGGSIRAGAKSVRATKGGDYARYKKKSAPAKSFRKSFAAASKAGKKTFTWDGRKYSTKKKK